MTGDLDPLALEMDGLLDALAAAGDGSEAMVLQEHAYALAYRALLRGDALPGLYSLAPRFDEVGLFRGSDWEYPAHLQAGLVEFTLRTPEGVGVECCSQLRFLAIAEGDARHPRVSAEEARRFLEGVLALNLDSLFPTEAPEPDDGDELATAVQHLFEFIVDCLGAASIMARLVSEAERILLTRPIKLQKVQRMIHTAARGVAAWGTSEVAREAALLVDALYGPTPLARGCETLVDYELALGELDDPAVLLEADTMATSMRRTGLVCPQHAVLVRHAAGRGSRLLARSLGIEDVGRTALYSHTLLIHELIDWAVGPDTAHAVYGLAQILDSGLLFQAPVRAGLRSLLDLPILEEVAAELVTAVPEVDPPARTVLIAGAINVLGMPRGVDQGHNPTCQSARAISLWAQNDPAYLLRLITQAARDGNVVAYFEGQPIASMDVERGVADELHTELDPISLLLTPHLDRLYCEMSRRALDRDVDEHKWVNPEFHGWWVQRGFAALIDEETGDITGPGDFVRLFYAAYHPRYNDGREVVMPQPAGAAITNSYGTFLDWHAISIQRVDEDPHGELRVYFFNPNHDKGQNWGKGVVTSTSDRGELMGESSLPFRQFASRLYVFHYDPNELGDPSAVPADEVDEVISMIQSSWGRAFDWADDEPYEETLAEEDAL